MLSYKQASKQIRSAVERDEYLPVKERNDVAMAVDGIEHGYLTWLIWATFKVKTRWFSQTRGPLIRLKFNKSKSVFF